MKNSRETLGLKNKTSLRLGLLVLSTLIIFIASALAYDRVVYESALNVGNTIGGTTGQGSTFSLGPNPALTTIAILGVVGLAVGLSAFGLLRKMPGHIGKTRGERESSPATPVSTPPGEEEGEESPKKEETGGIDNEILIALLNSRRRESETAE